MGRHSRGLHEERPELSAGHVEAEVRALHIAIERADRRADRDFAAFDEADIVVPQGEPTRSALVPELQVRDPAPGAVLAGESDRKSTPLNSSHRPISYALF